MCTQAFIFPLLFVCCLVSLNEHLSSRQLGLSAEPRGINYKEEWMLSSCCYSFLTRVVALIAWESRCPRGSSRRKLRGKLQRSLPAFVLVPTLPSNRSVGKRGHPIPWGILKKTEITAIFIFLPSPVSN